MTVYPFDDDAQSLSYPDTSVLKLALSVLEVPNGDGTASNAVTIDFPDHLSRGEIIEACAHVTHALGEVSQAHLRHAVDEAMGERGNDASLDDVVATALAIAMHVTQTGPRGPVARCAHHAVVGRRAGRDDGSEPR